MAKGQKSKFFRVMYALFSGVVKVLFNIRVVNPEKEPDEGGCLICANHVSAADAVVICYAFRKNQAHFMAKKELFKIPLLSGLIKLLGAFPVDRKGSDVSAIKKAIATVNRWVFDILGLENEKAEATGGKDMVSPLVTMLLDMRMQAKADKNWALSDEIRDKLTAIGIRVKDRKDGYDWEIE